MLKISIFDDAGGGTRFAVDQPSSVSSSFDNADIETVGLSLGHTLADLLDTLDVTEVQVLLAA